MKSWIIHRLTVSAEQAGERLDRFLAAAVDDLSRSRAKLLVDIGGVHLDGRRVRSCSRTVEEGAQIDVYIDHLPLEPFRFSVGQILYRDGDLVVLNKPAGIDTQPTHARYKGTVYEALQVLLADPARPVKKPELGMVQRLDRGTSGLMVFSTHPRAHRGLSKIFMEHQVEKRYLALVAGKPPDAAGELRSQLARTRRENRVVSVERGGKEAVTRYQVSRQFGPATLVELELLTGRSHQIRAHMAEIGCPLLGDVRYGGPAVCQGRPMERAMLHAVRLSFRHPVSGRDLDFEAPLPPDMKELIALLSDPERAG